MRICALDVEHANLFAQAFLRWKVGNHMLLLKNAVIVIARKLWTVAQSAQSHLKTRGNNRHFDLYKSMN